MIARETASTVGSRGEYGLTMGPDGRVVIDPKPAPNQVSSYVLDLCGFPKDRYYLYKSVWSRPGCSSG